MFQMKGISYLHHKRQPKPSYFSSILCGEYVHKRNKTAYVS